MPPDTIYIPDITGPLPPSQEWLDSIRANELIDSLRLPVLRLQTGNQPHYLLPEWQMFLIVVIIVLFMVGSPMLKEKIEESSRHNFGSKRIQGRDPQYDTWLTKYNPYYNSLSPAEKERFLSRTMRFMECKEFRFHAMVEEEYIPVLISAAAVQVTFGLKNYLLDYFPIIHVIRKEYTLDIDKETYYGHVSRNGIYISWDNFLEGYNDYDDSINLGLHEMAHAVSYDVYLGEQDEYDEDFKTKLQSFSEKGIPVFREMRKGTRYIIDDYGCTNFDEFWAVCVETFFENAAEFQRLLPGLYAAIAGLLNQNPLNPKKIIDPELAGLANW